MMKRWRSYRHRFTPWLAWNWSERQIKQIDSKTNVKKEKLAFSQLAELLKRLDKQVPQLSVREWRTILKRPEKQATLVALGRRAMKEAFGFELELRESRLVGGGRGVVVSEGCVHAGRIVGLYPGTVYLPFEPLLLQSIRNPFVFRCADGWSIDGHNRYLSKLIYRSCAFRDVIGHHMSCDVSWLSSSPVNPLSVGQFVNNHTRDVEANVEYVEVSVPPDFPLPWRRFLPNVFYSGNLDSITTSDERWLRCVALLSTRELHCGEELYSSYLTVVTDN